MENREAERIRFLKAKFVAVDPFFANLLNKLVVVPDELIPTAGTNGKYLKYNPNFFDSLSDGEAVFVLAHEVMHCALLHHVRINNRDREVWNLACDYVVNYLLHLNNHHLTRDALLDSRFYDMSAEKIYDILMKEREQSQVEENAGGGFGGGNFRHESQGVDGTLKSLDTIFSPEESFGGETPGITSTPVEQEISWKQSIESMRKFFSSRTAGTGSQKFLLAFDKVFRPSLDYKKLLNQFLTKYIHKKTTWRHTRRRLRSLGYVLPNKEREKDFLKIGVVVDTSGSMTHEMISRINRDLEEIRLTFMARMHFITVDYEVTDFRLIEPGEKFEFSYRGGGGTSYIPAFHRLDDVDVCLYYTDGFCDLFPTDHPRYPVMWIIPVFGNSGFSPPFGRTIYFD